MKQCNAFKKSSLTVKNSILFFLGPYPVGKTAKTPLPSAPAATKLKSNSTSSSSYFNSRGSYCVNFAAAGGRGNGKARVFVEGIPSSLAPRPPFFSRVLAPLSLPRLRLLRRLGYIKCMPPHIGDPVVRTDGRTDMWLLRH